MLKKQIFRFTGLVATAGLAFSLAACGGSSQSVADACEIFEKEVAGSEAQMESALTGVLSGDDVDLKATFDPAVEAIETAISKVSNEEVKAAATSFNVAFKDFAQLLGDLDLNALQMEDPEAMEAFEAFSAQLEEKSANLENAGTDLDTVCSAN